MLKRGVSINVIKSSSLEVNLTLSVQLRKLTSPVLYKYLHCTRTSSPFTTQVVQRIFPLLQQNKGRFPLSLIRAPSLIQNVFVSQKIRQRKSTQRKWIGKKLDLQTPQGLYTHLNPQRRITNRLPGSSLAVYSIVLLMCPTLANGSSIMYCVYVSKTYCIKMF